MRPRVEFDSSLRSGLFFDAISVTVVRRTQGAQVFGRVPAAGVKRVDVIDLQEVP